jgi:hypothetical protein
MEESAPTEFNSTPADQPAAELALPQPAEVTGKVPQPAEAFRTVPQDSETFRSVPQPAEAFRTIQQPSVAPGKPPAVRSENHTLTVREVARMFEAAGVARTERSIVNWCQLNAQGISRLDAYFDPNDRRYFITPESVDRAIAEERAKAVRTSEPMPNPVPQPATNEPRDEQPNRNDRPRQRERDRSDDETDAELRKELLDLKITNRAKDLFIEQLKEEREGFAAERQHYFEKLANQNRRVGQLEAELRLLGPEAKKVNREFSPPT